MVTSGTRTLVTCHMHGVCVLPGPRLQCRCVFTQSVAVRCPPIVIARAHLHAMPCLLAVRCLSLNKGMISDLTRVLACRYDMLRSCGMLLVVTVVWHPNSVIVTDLADAWHGLTLELEHYLDMF